MTPHAEALAALLAKAKNRISIKELHERFESLIAEGNRTREEVDDYRRHRGDVKKLCDEIFPVSRFFKHRNISKGFVSFPQDSEVPDAWWHKGKKKVGIEVTISQGRARQVLAEELVATKSTARGYLGLQDDASKEEVEKAKKSERTMYMTAQALSSTEKGILRCLTRKSGTKYEAMILVIEAPLSSLAPERWEPMVAPLKEAAKDLPFAEVYVLGKSDKLMGLKIK